MQSRAGESLRCFIIGRPHCPIVSLASPLSSRRDGSCFGGIFSRGRRNRQTQQPPQPPQPQPQPPPLGEYPPPHAGPVIHALAQQMLQPLGSPTPSPSPSQSGRSSYGSAVSVPLDQSGPLTDSEMSGVLSGPFAGRSGRHGDASGRTRYPSASGGGRARGNGAGAASSRGGLPALPGPQYETHAGGTPPRNLYDLHIERAWAMPLMRTPQPSETPVPADASGVFADVSSAGSSPTQQRPRSSRRPRLPLGRATRSGQASSASPPRGRRRLHTSSPEAPRSKADFDFGEAEGHLAPPSPPMGWPHRQHKGKGEGSSSSAPPGKPPRPGNPDEYKSVIPYDLDRRVERMRLESPSPLAHPRGGRGSRTPPPEWPGPWGGILQRPSDPVTRTDSAPPVSRSRSRRPQRSAERPAESEGDEPGTDFSRGPTYAP